MTQKRTKAEIPTDMWLHVATDALARYAVGAESEGIAIEFVPDGPMMAIYIAGISEGDARLAPSFLTLVSQAIAEGRHTYTEAAQPNEAPTP